jgi:hypothetical protein
MFAVCWVYPDLSPRVWASPPRRPAQRFVANILVAFLSAAGGAGQRVRLLADQRCPAAADRERRCDATGDRLWDPLLPESGDDSRSLAMIPGVSLGGATIMGAMILGVDRAAAAQFSFFLACGRCCGAALLSAPLYGTDRAPRRGSGAARLVAQSGGKPLALLRTILVARLADRSQLLWKITRDPLHFPDIIRVGRVSCRLDLLEAAHRVAGIRLCHIARSVSLRRPVFRKGSTACS